MKKEKEELIIVFKKDVTEKREVEVLSTFNVVFREGMDSSRGKLYFYATGGKYILTFKNIQDKEAFQLKRYQFLPEIHEIYEPDWGITKD